MFSSAVKLDQLNDYLNLSEECVLPVRRDGDSYEVKLKEKNKRVVNTLKTAEPQKGSNRILVGLSDCMSCSGCLTSAEEVILKDRGYADIAEKIRNAEFTAVSIAPQTAFMFAATYNVSHQTAFRRLAYFFKWMGAKRVYDMNLCEALALHESKTEFYNTLIASLGGRSRDRIQNGQPVTAEEFRADLSEHSIPLIAGHCPGWTVYAEKTLKKDIVAKISKVASSQQIQGALIKTLTYLENAAKQRDIPLNYTSSTFSGDYKGLNETLKGIYEFAKVWGEGEKEEKKSKNKVTTTRIYHVATAPCYDKKIEAANSQLEMDFTSLYGIIGGSNSNSNNNNIYERVKLVDDVISTGDIKRLMEQHKVDFRRLPEAELDRVFTDQMAFLYSKIFNQDIAIPNRSWDAYLRPGGRHSQSGGFAEEIMKFTAETISQTNIVPHFVKTINPDYQEAVMELDDGKPVMKFVMAYGFRNIQNIVQRIKKCDDQCPIAYIEVMACPGGCFNGAGQIIGPPEPGRGISTTIQAIIDRFRTTDMKPTEKALKQYHEEGTYIGTDSREDVKLLLSTVIPSFNRMIGGNIIAINVGRQMTDTMAPTSLKW